MVRSRGDVNSATYMACRPRLPVLLNSRSTLSIRHSTLAIIAAQTAIGRNVAALNLLSLHLHIVNVTFERFYPWLTLTDLIRTGYRLQFAYKRGQVMPVVSSSSRFFAIVQAASSPANTTCSGRLRQGRAFATGPRRALLPCFVVTMAGTCHTFYLPLPIPQTTLAAETLWNSCWRQKWRTGGGGRTKLSGRWTRSRRAAFVRGADRAHKPSRSQRNLVQRRLYDRRLWDVVAGAWRIMRRTSLTNSLCIVSFRLAAPAQRGACEYRHSDKCVNTRICREPFAHHRRASHGISSLSPVTLSRCCFSNAVCATPRKAGR